MISNILVAADGSESSVLAAKYAAYLATNLGARVTLLHVVQHPSFPFIVAGISDEERERMEQEVVESGKSILSLSEKPLADAEIAANMELGEGRPADVISHFASEGDFDLLIVGNRGQGRVSRVLLGSRFPGGGAFLSVLGACRQGSPKRLRQQPSNLRS